ncbi:MAG TPA: 1-deoxy-D-xylulose-5-phosphate reductoisomerase [Syntrophomonas sp.]|jgi:1-deoxy-D-xylulose-5-phosphate reductoisomerase|nr:1-deoxy-D-xylulose-5-phosphate reductoisomerase [Syntrophomonas sp.]
MHNIVILGSTGSIGTQALQVVDKHPDQFKVVGLAVKNETDQLARQIKKYAPRAVAVGDAECYQNMKTMAGAVTVQAGLEGLCRLAEMDEADTILVAVSGAVGIQPTLAAIEKGKRIALANKETLVAAGDIVMARARQSGAEIIPVDSEHSAVFQCLKGETDFLENIWLTASGGPFREYTGEQLEQVTVEKALQHPNWAMGPKITIDSATLMNKGLEVIEAHHLFGADYDHIKVLVQKESVIHSMAELVDGSFIAHLGAADMRIPIQYALSYPERFASPAQHLDFSLLAGISFQLPDTGKFPALKLAYAAGRQGGTMPAAMNAANEVAVNAFLQRQLKFTDIIKVVEKIMNLHTPLSHPQLEDILAVDSWARNAANEVIAKEVKD